VPIGWAALGSGLPAGVTRRAHADRA
jgi:hypothetical protein